MFKLLYKRRWQPTPVLLPGESQGWGSLVGCCLRGHTESDTTEVTWQLQEQHSFYILARLCSKSFKLCFKSMWTENFQMYELDLEEAEEPGIKLAT